jgi:hypothetical protein
MARRKQKPIALKVENWCSCSEWKEHQWQLVNHDKMRFCVFCGKELVKEKIV